MMRVLRSVAIGAAGVASLLVAPRWTLQTSGVTSTLRGVSAVNDAIAWATGSATTVLRTSDGGMTWQPITVTTDRLDFRDVDAIDMRTAYVLSIGNGTASRIYKTMDAGAHWVLQFTNADPKAFFDAMAFWDADHGIVVGDSVDGKFSILLTDDGGGSWTPAPSDGLPSALPNEGAFAASGTNVAVYGQRDVWFGTGAAEKARVLHSRDRGRTWTIADTPLISGKTAGIYSIAFRDESHGVIGGGDYTREKEATDNVAVTSDGGRTWTLVREQLVSAPAQRFGAAADATRPPGTRSHGVSGFRSLVAHVPGTTTAFIAVGPQGADWSEDDGRTWTPIEGPGFHTFSFSKTGKVGWGAGARGSVARLEVR